MTTCATAYPATVPLPVSTGVALTLRHMTLSSTEVLRISLNSFKFSVVLRGKLSWKTVETVLDWSK